MREALDQWNFIMAAYAIGIAGTVGMICWSLLSMRRAEARRDAVKRNGKRGG